MSLVFSIDALYVCSFSYIFMTVGYHRQIKIPNNLWCNFHAEAHKFGYDWLTATTSGSIKLVPPEQKGWRPKEFGSE